MPPAGFKAPGAAPSGASVSLASSPPLVVGLGVLLVSDALVSPVDVVSVAGVSVAVVLFSAAVLSATVPLLSSLAELLDLLQTTSSGTSTSSVEQIWRAKVTA
jgi:hypothetical protein